MAARLHLTLTLEPTELRELETLAEAERSTPAAYVQALVGQHLSLFEHRRRCDGASAGLGEQG